MVSVDIVVDNKMQQQQQQQQQQRWYYVVNRDFIVTLPGPQEAMCAMRCEAKQ
jgi:hypothetical protein